MSSEQEQQQEQQPQPDPRQQQEELLLSSPQGRELRSRVPFDYHPRDLRRIPVAQDAINVVLVLSGSFNPVHRAHVKALQYSAASIERQLTEQSGSHRSAAAAALSLGANVFGRGRDPQESEQQRQQRSANQQAKVVAVALIPSSDSYVRGKLGNEALNLTTRCDLCDRAALEETEEHVARVLTSAASPVTAAAGGGAQAQLEAEGEEAPTVSPGLNAVIDQQQHQFDQQQQQATTPPQSPSVAPYYPVLVLDYGIASASRCCVLLEQQLAELHPGAQFCARPVYGSDFAAKYRVWNNDMVCIERHDEERSGEYVRRMVAEGKTGPGFLFVAQEPGVDVFGGVSHASSTAVRNALRTGDRAQLNSMLHSSVVDAMLERGGGRAGGGASKAQQQGRNRGNRLQ